MHHGKILEEILKKKKLRKIDYAEMLGMSSTAVTDRVRMEEFPPNIIEEVVKYLGVSPSIFPKIAKKSVDEIIAEKDAEVIAAKNEVIELQKELIEAQKELIKQGKKAIDLEEKLKILEEKNFMEAYKALLEEQPERYRPKVG